MSKIIWKVAKAPTGRYRSFYKRDWPVAYMLDDHPILAIYCDESYTPEKAKSGDHSELKVKVAQWFEREGMTPSFKWLTMKRRFKSLDEAKEAGAEWYLAHPEFWPPELRPK